MPLLTPNPDGTVNEGAAPKELPSNAVTLLEIFGDMVVAGAETMEAQLPAVKQAERAVVILRLRAARLRRQLAEGTTSNLSSPLAALLNRVPGVSIAYQAPAATASAGQEVKPAANEQDQRGSQ